MRASRLVHAGLVRLDPDTLEPRPYLARGWRMARPADARGDAARRRAVPLGRAARAARRGRDDRALRIAGARRRARAAWSTAIAEVREDGEHEVRSFTSRGRTRRCSPISRSPSCAPIRRARRRRRAALDGLGPYASSARHEARCGSSPPTAARCRGPRTRVRCAPCTTRTRARCGSIGGRHRRRAEPASRPRSSRRSARSRASASRRGPARTSRTWSSRDDHGPFADARVRRAFGSRSIAPMLVRVDARRARAPATGLIAAGPLGHADAPPLPFDPARGARAPRGGARRGARTCTLLASTDRLRGDSRASSRRSSPTRASTVDVVPLELGTLLARLDAGDFDLAVLQLPEMTEPNVLRRFLHAHSFRRRARTAGACATPSSTPPRRGRRVLDPEATARHLCAPRGASSAGRCTWCRSGTRTRSSSRACAPGRSRRAPRGGGSISPRCRDRWSAGHFPCREHAARSANRAPETRAPDRPGFSRGFRAWARPGMRAALASIRDRPMEGDDRQDVRKRQVLSRSRSSISRPIGD